MGEPLFINQHCLPLFILDNIQLYCKAKNFIQPIFQIMTYLKSRSITLVSDQGYSTGRIEYYSGHYKHNVAGWRFQ